MQLVIKKKGDLDKHPRISPVEYGKTFESFFNVQGSERPLLFATEVFTPENFPGGFVREAFNHMG